MKRAMQQLRAENACLRGELDASKHTLEECRHDNLRLLEALGESSGRQGVDPDCDADPHPTRIGDADREKNGWRSQLEASHGVLKKTNLESARCERSKTDLSKATGKLLQEMRNAWVSLRTPTRCPDENETDLLRDSTIQALNQLIINFREEVEQKNAALAAKDEALGELHQKLHNNTDGQSTPSSPRGSLHSGGGDVSRWWRFGDECDSLNYGYAASHGSQCLSEAESKSTIGGSPFPDSAMEHLLR